MNGRDRFLIALNNEKPDRLPCQVHSFMAYYLAVNGFLGSYRAYKYFNMDPVLYVGPGYIFDDKDREKWREVNKFKGYKRGTLNFLKTVHTPKGDLTTAYSFNKFTNWIIEPLIKSEEDFELFKEFYPVPTGADWSRVIRARDKVGDNGIVRSGSWGYWQSGAFQSLASLMDVEKLIYKIYDNPEWVHYALSELNKKYIAAAINAGKVQCDLMETGGGAGSSTVISPDIHKNFCLPYDIKLHEALKSNGARISYHLCGGLMPLLDIVKGNGADVLETMTPPDMGGDCDLYKAAERVGDRLAFIGGLDQNKFFEHGTPKAVREEVFRLFRAKPNGGYICSPSDHFFFGAKENIKAFADACRECEY